MRIFLIRHGQTPSNVGHHLDTDAPGAPLTDLGHQQAEALVALLGETGIEAIYASNLVRTQQTAAPLAEALGLGVAVRSGVREISAGALEMANDQQSIQTYLSVALGWADGQLKTPMPGGGPDGEAELARFDEVVEEVAASGVQTAAIFTHGAIIRVWAAARCENLDAAYSAENSVSNTGAVIVEGSPGNWRATQWQEQAIGGADLEDPATDGASADTLARD
ncbi:histidine phosphatase family protein [Glutamicibacter arilaitensis]|uniref:histidine phosphatase family protein n=1 Tax=Glutamicibacter arilaitensis TaxID=256701 RepID=UPI00384EADB0